MSDPVATAAPQRLRERVALEIADLKGATQVIVENHYLHRGRTMAQIAYWVTLDGHRCGVLLFALPRMSAKSEKFGNYGPMNLVELARMWLDPKMQGLRLVDHNGMQHSFPVATAAIGKALRRIRQDWHGKYPHLPLIQACVSWADEVHHEGTVYRASNFREVGRSGGSLHGHGARKGGGLSQPHPDYLHIKRAFLFEYTKPLTARQRAEAIAAWNTTRPKRRPPTGGATARPTKESS